jgi:phosphoribosylformylglycinamidine synthase
MKIYRSVSKVTGKNLANSLHTPAIGGLAAGFAKIAMAGRLGLEIDMGKIPVSGKMTAHELLFSESNSRFIMTVSPKNRKSVENILKSIPHAEVGKVAAGESIAMKSGRKTIIEASISELLKKYKGTLAGI